MVGIKIFEKFLNEKLARKSDKQITKNYSLTADGDLKTFTDDQIAILNDLRARVGQGLSNGKGMTDELYNVFNLLTRKT